ncbi:hypothetical protein D3C71_1289320 [compost metagenome]
MHAHEATAVADELLHRRLLRGVEYIAGGIGEDHGAVAGEGVRAEIPGVVARVRRHAGLGTQLAQRRHGHGNRVVVERGGAAEDQDAVRTRRGGKAG